MISPRMYALLPGRQRLPARVRVFLQRLAAVHGEGAPDRARADQEPARIMS